jgi:hypothetical protein
LSEDFGFWRVTDLSLVRSQLPVDFPKQLALDVLAGLRSCADQMKQL